MLFLSHFFDSVTIVYLSPTHSKIVLVKNPHLVEDKNIHSDFDGFALAMGVSKKLWHLYTIEYEKDFTYDGNPISMAKTWLKVQPQFKKQVICPAWASSPAALAARARSRRACRGASEFHIKNQGEGVLPSGKLT
jgi:hypothetical protein